MFRVVIPARYASSRLAAKALASIGGKPMVQWVYERARECRAAEIWVATDHPDIAQAVEAFGGHVMMTSAAHPSGTDRIAEVAVLREWSPDDIVVNVQGDEPMIPAALIDQVAALLENDPTADMATLCAPIGSTAEFMDPNVVKVVFGTAGQALYFSRAPIPWPRERPPEPGAGPESYAAARRHVGIYGYRCSALARLAGHAPVALELLERLEQLRALALGMRIRVAEACVAPGPDVNTAADLERLRGLLVSTPR